MNRCQQKAVWIALQVLKKIKIVAGQTELKVAEWINLELKKYGAKPAFRAIVASGRRSAIPHGYATNKKIMAGELVVVDFGALYNGYRSDLTRTFVVGKITARTKKIIQIVYNAQQKAIRAVHTGAVCSEVDRAARDYIKRNCRKICNLTGKKCPGDCFIHTTGHGIGRKVHQGPRISSKNRHRLKTGQVITIEPGIYIKGWGGVRIEDMLIVTEKGSNLLTRKP